MFDLKKIFTPKKRKHRRRLSQKKIDPVKHADSIRVSLYIESLGESEFPSFEDLDPDVSPEDLFKTIVQHTPRRIRQLKRTSSIRKSKSKCRLADLKIHDYKPIAHTPSISNVFATSQADLFAARKTQTKVLPHVSLPLILPIRRSKKPFERVKSLAYDSLRYLKPGLIKRKNFSIEPQCAVDIFPERQWRNIFNFNFSIQNIFSRNLAEGEKQDEQDSFDSTSAESDADSISLPSFVDEEDSSKETCHEKRIIDYRKSVDGAHIPTDSECSHCDDPHKKRITFMPMN